MEKGLSALNLGLTEAEKLHFSVLQMPLRAEEIPYEQLLQLSKSIPFGLKRIVTNLTDFLAFNNFSRRFLLGLKGSGKTLAALIATLVVSEKCGLRIAYFLFKKDSNEIVTFPSLQKVEMQSLFSEASIFDAVIVDDIHYMCEHAIENPTFCHQLIVFLTEVLQFAERNKKKVLFISENPLFSYAEKINDRDMDKVCHSLGQFAKFGDMHPEIDWFAFSEIPYLNFDDFCRFLAWCNVDVDASSSILLYRIARLPRRLLIVLRKMNANKFSLNEVTSRAIEELRLNGNQHYVDLLQKLPVLEKGWELENREYRFSFTREIRDEIDRNPEVEGILKRFSEELLAIDPHLKLRPSRRTMDIQMFNMHYNRYYQIISRAFNKFGYYGILTRINSSSLSTLHKLGLLIDSGIKVEKTVWYASQGKQEPLEYISGVLVTPFLKAFFGED
jgi:hypothetical protein